MTNSEHQHVRKQSWDNIKTTSVTHVWMTDRYKAIPVTTVSIIRFWRPNTHNNNKIKIHLADTFVGVLAVIWFIRFIILKCQLPYMYEWLFDSKVYNDVSNCRLGYTKIEDVKKATGAILVTSIWFKIQWVWTTSSNWLNVDFFGKSNSHDFTFAILRCLCMQLLVSSYHLWLITV